MGVKKVFLPPEIKNIEENKRIEKTLENKMLICNINNILLCKFQELLVNHFFNQQNSKIPKLRKIDFNENVPGQTLLSESYNLNIFVLPNGFM